jgi:hypothetical protein
MIKTRVIAINTKLFIVEGLSGTGKNATVEYMAEFLSSSGFDARWYDDKDLNHPTEYTFHAFMREDQIRQLTQSEQRQILSEGIKKRSGYAIPLTKVSVKLFEKILPYKVYGRLDWETEKAVMLEHWQEFADEWQWSNTVHVVDSCLLQNPVTEMMMRFDFGDREIQSYARSICGIVAGFEPVVIYLKSSNVEMRIEETRRERGSGWLDMMMEAHTIQGYAKRCGLSGMEGYIACLEERQRRELETLEKLPVTRLVITDPYENWDEAQDRLTRYLGTLIAVEARV